MQFRRIINCAEAVQYILEGDENALTCIDLETTGLSHINDQIVDIAYSHKDNEAVLFSADCIPALKCIPRRRCLLFHNMSFDLRMLKAAGIDLMRRFCRDTMLIAHLLDEEQDYALDDLIKKYLPNEDHTYKQTFWEKYDNYSASTEDDRIRYALRDVLYTRRLWGILYSDFRNRQFPVSLLRHVHKLSKTLISTEYDGISVDLDYLMQKGTDIKARISTLLPQMKECVKEEINLIEYELWDKALEKKKTAKGKSRVERPEFNFNSNTQMLELLYGKLGLPVQKNEKTKKPSTDAKAISRLEGKHPLLPLLTEYKEHEKIYTAFIEGTLERIGAVGSSTSESRIYPEFNVNGTLTGRISHSKPNLGQMPRTGGIRGIYKPCSKYVFISADYANLEVYIAAHFSRDPSLLKIVNEGASQHDITAEALGIDRQLAKTLNFAFQFGASHFKAAKILNVSEEEGKRAYDRYWATYSGVKRMMSLCSSKVDLGEYVVNPFGRRRHFQKKHRNPWDSAYRQSWNSLVQGTGADITSKALYRVDKKLRKLGWGNALFSVHDEIIIQVKEEHAKEAEELLIQTMINVGHDIKLTVALNAKGSGPMGRWQD